jgi:hypothetical protein
MKLKESWFVITQLYKVDQTLGKNESLCSKNLRCKKKNKDCVMGFLGLLRNFKIIISTIVICFKKPTMVSKLLLDN